jgi:hypothetical protein
MKAEGARSMGTDAVSVWTSEGYEGRFLQWNGDLWQATEYRNFRHWFGAPQPLGPNDVEALRKEYGVAANTLADGQLIHTAPDRLRQLHSERRMPDASPRSTDEG